MWKFQMLPLLFDFVFYLYGPLNTHDPQYGPFFLLICCM